MRIREAEMKDAIILDEMLTRLIHYERRWDDNLDGNFKVTDNYANMIGREGCKLYLAEDNGAICGFLCAIVYDAPLYLKPVVLLDALYIEEAFRNRGCATALILELKRYARSINACSIELKVFSENEPANRLYSECGFEEIKKYMQIKLSAGHLSDRP